MAKKEVLFLCTGNSCRSQMAEGWLRHLGNERFTALSAGTDPQGLNPLAVQVMTEAGVDISRQRSKSVDEFLGGDIDLLITVCGEARESCPVFIGKVRERRHWPLPDPAQVTGPPEEVLDFFRRVRDSIRSRVEDLLSEGD
ncbi:MAG: arsenate reductase ArsC [Deltaproteobacteria bacterium]|nr:arsenate reductase ArsC [Deltaproteobacteria bacterium]